MEFRNPDGVETVKPSATILALGGASWHQIQGDDPAEAIVSFAREQQITQIVTGSIQSSWWHIPGGGPILRRVIHEAGASGIDVHLIARREPPPGAAQSSNAVKES